ncbi:MAG TPA: ABC transporter ATP-binding protein [Mycobacteriales bacterium]|jgi:branched-chain amino acid transport system ATP-binding protein|nr:ABC transporter ATP-binding protein [Mycobacteriales bacterium]
MRFELEGVTAGYGDAIMLRDVDLVVPAGTIVALLGPNGAGKTTLLRVASGLLRPSQGRIRIDGDELAGRPAERFAQAGICHVTEGRSVFPGLTVRENLRMFAAKGTSAEAEALERAVAAFPKLGQRLSQVAGTMSGGEQQMLALSRAYVQRAPVVMLDEVSMGLAPIVVDAIFEFLQKLVAEGSSLLLVEQYVAKALDLATHVYLLSRGRIVFRGEPAELIGNDIMSSFMGSESALKGV